MTTKAFHTEEEHEIHDMLSWIIGEKIAIEEYTLFNTILKTPEIVLEKKDSAFLKRYKFENYSDYKQQKSNDKYLRKFLNKLFKNHKWLKKSDEFIKGLKVDSLDTLTNKPKTPLHKIYTDDINTLNQKLNKIVKNSDMNLIRKLNPKALTTYSKISIFESFFSRTLDLRINQTTTDIFIVKVTEKKYYPIMEQLVNNSFTLWNYNTYQNEKYLAFTATAGQIRLKKLIFIKESVYKKYIKRLMCGLTIEDINNSVQHGCNVNKFLAYLGLIFTDSDKWEGFDIDKAIVIDDFETEVKGMVDYVDNEKFTVTPQEMKVPICHSDGCGWILPTESQVNFQFRLPWMKGLLTPVNYLSYCSKFNENNYEIKDIYGKTWDLKKSDIRYVFFKSQFKMWKYYPNILNEDDSIKEYGWDTYKNKFKENECHASKSHEETGEFKDGRFNYQMMQTLTEIEDKELEALIKPTKDIITKAYTDKDTMLQVLGAVKGNINKNYLQQALELYPALLNDYHIREQLSETISAKRKDAKFARIKINATSTFILPDVFAWLQYTFSDDKTINPKGLLADGEVYCRLYSRAPKLLCNRSPHLWKEHAVRKNVASKKSEWFITDGLYASSHDLISKQLCYDVDGDSSLIVGDKNIIDIAERNMKEILPLYYVMGKAEPEIISNKSIYESIKKAWDFGNIGKYSNMLTKFWNNYESNSDLDIAKVICSLNNFSIDAAKTKLMPKVPKEIKESIKAIRELDMPYFAQFAKDNLVGKVAERNESTVNRLCAKIEEIKIRDYDFSGAGRFRSSKLMHNPRIVANDEVTKKYDELNELKDSYFMKAKNANLTKDEVATAIYTQIRTDLLSAFPSLGIVDITDMIIKHVYKNHRSCKKSFLFNCFGDIIVENLKVNVKPLKEGHMICPYCNKQFEKKGNNQKRCPECSKKLIREKDRSRKRK